MKRIRSRRPIRHQLKPHCSQQETRPAMATFTLASARVTSSPPGGMRLVNADARISPNGRVARPGADLRWAASRSSLHPPRELAMRYLLPFIFLGLAGCIHSETVKNPPTSTTYVTPAQPSSTTVVRTP